ncbi:MAG: acyl-CoA thioesterase [Nitrososphaerota archaeon]|jgi:acyl-CoA thioester hydrolase|nr:acyl-CoA thioesterase [Nitrososphaerota archaeon]
MKEFSIRMRVPWSDTDAAGVVHFANYFRYFERVELELYRKLGFAYSKSLMKMGLWFARVEAHCSYLSPCEFDDEIEVKMRLTTLGRRSVKYGMEVLNLTTGKVAAKGHIVIVSANKSKKRAVPLPDEFREALQKYFVS